MEAFVNQFFDEMNTTAKSAAGFCMKVILALIIFFIGVKLIHWVRNIAKRSLGRINADEGVTKFIDNSIRIILYIILILVILSFFGVQPATIAAILASAGLALGMSIQGSLSNVAGGVLILILKPFQVGDYIIEDAHKNEGTVKEIGLFYTKLATIDYRIVVLPNGTLANTSITNVTREDARKLDLTVGISYESDIKKTKEILYDVVRTDPSTIKEDELQVFVKELADSAVIMGIRSWVVTDQFWDSRCRILENIKLRFDEAGIDIPYNQVEISFKDKKTPLRNS